MFIAANYGDRLYLYDSTSWAEEQPAGDADINWNIVNIGLNGTGFIAGVNPGRLYTGATAALGPANIAKIMGIASASVAKLSGVTWTDIVSVN